MGFDKVDSNRTTISEKTNNPEAIAGNSNFKISNNKANEVAKGGNSNIQILENKKRRTCPGCIFSPNVEIDIGSEEEEQDVMDQEKDDGSKNDFGAGSESRTRLAL